MDVSLINELLGILDKEAEIYEGILKISKNKTAIVVEGKVGDLDKITKVEQSLVLQIGKLENKREEIVRRLGMDLHLQDQEATISDLVRRLDQEQAQELKKRQDRIALVLDELKSANHLNAKLIKNSLEYIDFSINILTAVEAQNNNYGDSGKVNDGKKRSLFDVKL